MLSEAYRLYVDETLAFVRTFVYKVEVQNDLLNERLVALGYTVLDDPTTWKYNLNLTGAYHDTDIAMTVVSSDTKETISFDKATLVSHPRTLLAHQRGESAYTALVDRYPRQETLINGIVNPIDMATVTAADEFELIDYDGSYLQDNERTLMRRVQDWINIYVKRWWNPQLAITNDLYPADFVAKMNMLLVGVVATIRMELSQTNEVDEQHLWWYLGDHYQLDDFQSNLSLTQALWLFRNLDYLRRNAGTEENFELLIDNLLTPAGLSLERLDFLQLDDQLLTSLKREVAFSLTDHDSNAPSLASGDRLTATEACNLVMDVAPYNAEDADIDLAHIETKGAALKQNWLPTKVYRASEDGSLITQEISNLDVKVNYWAYLSYLGLYEPQLTVTSASIGSLYLTPLNAFILYIYAANMSFERALDTIPEITVKGVIPVTLPTATDLYDLVDHDKITVTEIQDIIDQHVSLEALSTVEDFTTFIDAVVVKDAIRDMMEEGYPHPDVRAMMRDISDGLKTDITIPLAPEGTAYTEWLYALGIDYASLSTDEWYELSSAITSDVIDYSGNTTSVGRKQKAMIEIVNRLTSYDVRILAGSSSERKRVINFPDERYFDINVDTPVKDFIQYGDRVPDDETGNIGIVVGNTIDMGEEVSLPEQEAVSCEVDFGTDDVDLTITEAYDGNIDGFTDFIENTDL